MKSSTLKRTSEDRISSLPSSLIGHILSFLPTKDAVATSVLSTPWKEMWKSVTCLSFDDYYLLQTLPNNRGIESLQKEFADFVYRVMLLGSFSCIETFRLHCVAQTFFDPLYVRAWLASVLPCKVQEVDIHVPQIRYSLLPTELFTCRTLVKLKLGTEIYLNVPSLVSLPCLKLVELSWVRFLDDDSITRFLSGCPVLDTLKMKKCVGADVKVIKICNPLLASLDLTFLRYEEDEKIIFSPQRTLRIVLETPFLSNFFMEDHVHQGYVLENLHKLMSAHIQVRNPVGKHTFSDIHHDAMSDLLKGISKVQKLHFFTRARDGHRLIDPFEDLKDLAIVVHHNSRFQMVFNFLERSPQLCFLRTTFDHYHVISYSPEAEYPLGSDLPQLLPYCLSFHLKVIEIVNFQGYSKEVKLVEYFLKNAQVLEKLTVNFANFSAKEKSLRVCDRFRILPRASRFCQIHFV